MGGSGVFDIDKFLDGKKVSAYHLTVLALCTLIMAVDGYDVFVVGYVLPAMAKTFGVVPHAVTPVFVAQGLGMAVGTYLISPLADRFGRRTLLMVSAAVFGALTLCATQATNVSELLTLRFIAGLFFSGVFPNAIALTTEIAPSRLRGRFVSILFVGYVGGTVLAGAVGALLLHSYGWQGAFWVGGLMPLVILPLMLFVLPESPRFCLQRDDRDPRIADVLKRIDPALSLDAGTRFVMREETRREMPVAALFRDGRARTTLLLWVAFFMNLLLIQFMGAWMPTFLKNFASFSMQKSAVVTAFWEGCGMIATLICGFIIDRFRVKIILTAVYLLAGLSVASIGQTDMNSWALYAALTFCGLGIVGGQAGINALAAMVYPTRMRATGVGWAFGAGRLGAMSGPIVGGTMLAGHWSAHSVFAVAAIPMLVAALCAFSIRATGQVDEAAPAEGQESEATT